MTLLIVSLFLPSTISSPEHRIQNYIPNSSLPSALKRRNTGSKLVSELESIELVPNSHGNIGLQNAIASIGSDKLDRKWIGTLGLSTVKMSLADDLCRKLAAIDQIPVFVSEKEMDGHYNQFCKRVI